MRTNGTHPKRRRTRGFSLIEVVVALGILAVGLLALTIMQLEAFRSGATGHHVHDATRIARAEMEQIQRMPFATIEAEAGNGWQAPAWINQAGFNAGEIGVLVQTPGGGTRTQEVYDVAWRVTTVGGNATLMNVDLEVSWNAEKGPNNRPTRTGRPTVTLSSVRYNW